MFSPIAFLFLYNGSMRGWQRPLNWTKLPNKEGMFHHPFWSLAHCAPLSVHWQHCSVLQTGPNCPTRKVCFLRSNVKTRTQECWWCLVTISNREQPNLFETPRIARIILTKHRKMAFGLDSKWRSGHGASIISISSSISIEGPQQSVLPHGGPRIGSSSGRPRQHSWMGQ